MDLLLVLFYLVVALVVFAPIFSLSYLFIDSELCRDIVGIAFILFYSCFCIPAVFKTVYEEYWIDKRLK